MSCRRISLNGSTRYVLVTRPATRGPRGGAKVQKMRSRRLQSIANTWQLGLTGLAWSAVVVALIYLTAFLTTYWVRSLDG